MSGEWCEVQDISSCHVRLTQETGWRFCPVTFPQGPRDGRRLFPRQLPQHRAAPWTATPAVLVDHFHIKTRLFGSDKRRIKMYQVHRQACEADWCRNSQAITHSCALFGLTIWHCNWLTDSNQGKGQDSLMQSIGLFLTSGIWCMLFLTLRTEHIWLYSTNWKCVQDV